MRITGNWATRTVKVNNKRLSPRLSQKLINHSPDGFSWGYGGSGPMQLALALLLKGLVEPRRAMVLHAEFKRQFIEPLPQADFAITVNVWAWADEQVRRAAEVLAMGYILAFGACCACQQFFSFNPERVPSTRVNGRREPMCRACVERANERRRAAGVELIEILPDAYEPADEYDVGLDDD